MRSQQQLEARLVLLVVASRIPAREGRGRERGERLAHARPHFGELHLQPIAERARGRAGRHEVGKEARVVAHPFLLREIDARRQIIVLVTDVALDAAEINEARFGDRVVVFSVGSGHQVNTHVGTVGGFEAAEAQHLLAVRQFIDRRHALGFMSDATEVTFRDSHGHRRRCGQRRLSEVHPEARAPDRDVFVLVQVGVCRNVVVLVSFVALHGTEVDEASLFDGVIAFVNFCGG